MVLSQSICIWNIEKNHHFHIFPFVGGTLENKTKLMWNEWYEITKMSALKNVRQYK